MAEAGGLHQLRVEPVRRAGARESRRRGGGAGGLRPARGIGRLGRWGGAYGLPRNAAGRVARTLLCVSLLLLKNGLWRVSPVSRDIGYMPCTHAHAHAHVHVLYMDMRHET